LKIESDYDYDYDNDNEKEGAPPMRGAGRRKAR
jgi:hypothetical protein